MYVPLLLACECMLVTGELIRTIVSMLLTWSEKTPHRRCGIFICILACQSQVKTEIAVTRPLSSGAEIAMHL